ncbi:hypothetical protein [Actinoplanes sp. NBRC 103695]|uniref:hypothetical protein n=1 Tax=Actinoplanes sp. NBRC 103695 TaxID=3032202 RepID=UPI0024A2EAFF|nr:hypothetical protein [Actinoplanes sp. NBRC 103695]GLZ01879.1 hypothetical protein Acsp02_91300 [Actinoplanes sp. NBRC 103695]
MSDHGRTNQTLTLLAKSGTYEVLYAMHARGGAATFAQIAVDARQALALLRALAAEGFVIGPRCGSLDIMPSPQTIFCLTAKGKAVSGHVVRLQQWIIKRSACRATEHNAL